MRRVLIRVAYDGTGFAGYQRQVTERTVQAVLEDALHALHDHPVATVAAGRTDAGVHATGQHVTFDTDRATIGMREMPAAINSRLPVDVRVLSAREVAPAFHARFDARGRHYRYRLVAGTYTLPHLRAYAWRVRELPDVDRLNTDAAAFVGTHDFTTFAARRKDQTSMVRTVRYSHWRQNGEYLEYAIGADGFLWHMVRSIVGTMVEREKLRLRGDLPGETIRTLLAMRERRRAGTTAPAWGLFLHDVEYEQ
jgi:tRNA pseudouridine38-40 synthase